MKKLVMVLVAVMLSLACTARADLVMHFTMDESSGSLTDQVGGKVANPVGDGHVYGEDGMIGDAGGMAGGGSWQLSVADSSVLQNLSNDFTVSAWVYWDGTIAKSGLNSIYCRIIGDDTPWDADCWSFGFVTDGRLSFVKNGIVEAFSTAKPVVKDQWMLLSVAVSAANGVEYYVNGALVETITDTTDLFVKDTHPGWFNGTEYDDPFAVGRANGETEEQWFPGLLDDVRVYDHVLTAADVAALYTAGQQKAQITAPAAADSPISVNPTFEWTAPAAYAVTAYDLVYSTDPNIQSDVVTVSGITETQYTLVDPLEYETTYYARVDAYDGATKYEGITVSFTTAPASPIITTQPQTVVVVAGDDAVFTIAGLNITGYQWYFNDVQLSGQTSDTLAVSAVQSGNEGSYYCVVTNGTEDLQSDVVMLLTERKVANWKLDNNLTDSVGGFDAASVDAPLYEAAMENEGISLAGGDDPNDIIEVAYDETLNTKSFSFSVWAKSAGGAGSYRAVVSNRNAPSGVTPEGFVVYAMANNKWGFWIGTNGGWAEIHGPAVVENEWVLLSGSYDDAAKKVTFYVDGVAVNGGVLNEGIEYQPNDTTGLRIGFGENEVPQGNFYFNGQIDNVQLWDYAIDEITMAHLYADVTGQEVCTGAVEFDFNDDCVVNLADLAIFAEGWLDTNIVKPAGN